MTQRKMVRLALFFFFCLGTTTAWSKRTHYPGGIATSESKVVAARYSGGGADPKSAHHPGDPRTFPGHPEEEYVDSEDRKSVKEEDEAQGNEESEDTAKSDEYDEHSERGGHKEFKAGGFSFDKHLKDHKADNKEIENVKQHDIGEKFGGEIKKEHKLGKHKEKSKGHKLHGFKNVYHKEEYGDHKTFHDEFLDTDHQHNYDDHHEHQEVEGGKFSKGFRHEGKNNKYDKGDEKHEWGKEDFDLHGEGNHSRGGNKSKQRHATKKHLGHYDANAQRQKNAVHTIKKGEAPLYGHHGDHHHGPHPAQMEPFVPHSHHDEISSHNYGPPIDTQSHPDGDSHGSNEAHGNHYQAQDDHHPVQSGQYENGHNEYPASGRQDDYVERTAQINYNANSRKEAIQDKSDEKLIPSAKAQHAAHKHDSMTHQHEVTERVQEPVSYKTQPQNPTVRRDEPRSYKPHTHHHHAHKHPFTTSHYRKPVFRDSSHPRSSQLDKPEKFSEPFNVNPNHKITYGFQPRSHQQHNHKHRYHHSSSSQSQPQQQESYPRFNHHHPSGAHHHHHHHHFGPDKNQSHFRHVPSRYQQASGSESHVPRSERTHATPGRSEHRPVILRKLYE